MTGSFLVASKCLQIDIIKIQISHITEFGMIFVINLKLNLLLVLIFKS